MDHENLYQQYKDTEDHRVLLSFKGTISQEVVTEFGSMIRSSLSAESNIKKIFAVFIELAQNIVRYSSEQEPNPDGNAGVGIILLREKKETYYLSSGNMIQNENVTKVRERCDKVNSMNKDELKAYYQEKIRKPPEEGSKGAGIGLIDIARKSDGPLKCAISEIDTTHSFLTLTVTFKKEKR